MGLLFMNASEHMLSRQYITEAFRMLGTECLLYIPSEIIGDVHNDNDIKYNDPIEMDLLFESHPEPILENYDWYSEEDQEPYVAYISGLSRNYEKLRVQKDSMVEVPQYQVDELTYKKFLITQVKGSKLNPLFWTCKLVPIRDKAEIEEVKDYESPRSTSMGYSYIKRRDPNK